MSLAKAALICSSCASILILQGKENGSHFWSARFDLSEFQQRLARTHLGFGSLQSQPSVLDQMSLASSTYCRNGNTSMASMAGKVVWSWHGVYSGQGCNGLSVEVRLFEPSVIEYLSIDSFHCSALAAKGYRCIGSINRSYKNTYFLMQKTKEPITVKPPLFSMSIISDKKVQFDDHIGSSVIIPELQSLLRKLDNLVAYGGTRYFTTLTNSLSLFALSACFRSSYSKRVCVFNQGMFKYDYDERIALHLATFLLVLQMADSIGFSLYASGNISGRFVYNGEDKVVILLT